MFSSLLFVTKVFRIFPLGSYVTRTHAHAASF